MRLLPRSLFGRLLAIATLTTLAALVFAAFTIGHVLERFVIRGLDQQLDAQIGLLTKAVQPDGRLDPARVVTLPAFDEPGAGWSWSVEGPRGRRWNEGSAIDIPVERPDHHWRERRPDEPRPGDTRDAFGEPIHFRQSIVETPVGPVIVTASGPRRIALAPLREAMVPLLGSLAVLGAGLALATGLQLRFGLRPLRTLRASLAEVRAGRLRHIPLDLPDELVPLASELNALIDQNEAGLEHARRHVSNLAHGLKTPLASLALKLSENERDPGLSEIVTQIDQRIRHHLARARSVAASGGRRVQTLLAPAIADLAHALARIHAERMIAPSIEIAPDIGVAIDPHDLTEMVGNLLDNAWRHARSRIRIAALRVDATIVLTIDDDGPGMAGALVAEALKPGRRLDERGDGHGFGLPIVEELAELNGGELALLASPDLGGLRVRLTLPANG